MKKMFIVLLVMIAGLNADAQTTYWCYQTRFAKLDTYQNKWIWEKPTDVTMMITIDKYDVYFDNKTQSHIHLIGSKVEGKLQGGKKFTWQAIDEDKKRCQIMLAQWDDGSDWQIYLIYDIYRLSFTMSPSSKDETK